MDPLTVLLRCYVLPGVGAMAFCCLAVATAFVVEQVARDLVADVQLAMARAGLSLKWVGLTIRAPQQRLSDQLNGKQPFTLWWRFYSPAMMRTAFWSEFKRIRAAREGDHYFQGDLARLIRRIERLDEPQEEKVS